MYKGKIDSTPSTPIQITTSPAPLKVSAQAAQPAQVILPARKIQSNSFGGKIGTAPTLTPLASLGCNVTPSDVKKIAQYVPTQEIADRIDNTVNSTYSRIVS